MLHYCTSNCITLHYITLHYITLHYITLHYITLHCIALHCIPFHSIPFHSIPFHSITLHYITLHYITLHYITLHYITLHYITLHFLFFFFFPSSLILGKLSIFFGGIPTLPALGNSHIMSCHTISSLQPPLPTFAPLSAPNCKIMHWCWIQCGKSSFSWHSLGHLVATIVQNVIEGGRLHAH